MIGRVKLMFDLNPICFGSTMGIYGVDFFCWVDKDIYPIMSRNEYVDKSLSF